jgi:hypothetical protein
MQRFKDSDVQRRVVLPKDKPEGTTEERGVLLGPAKEPFRVWVRVDRKYRRGERDDLLRLCDEDYVELEDEYDRTD